MEIITQIWLVCSLYVYQIITLYLETCPFLGTNLKERERMDILANAKDSIKLNSSNLRMAFNVKSNILETEYRP